MLLVLRARALKDPLYEAYCEYEQLKIFLKLNLAYVESLFKKPFDEYDKLLRRLKQKMLSEREVKDLDTQTDQLFQLSHFCLYCTTNQTQAQALR